MIARHKKALLALAVCGGAWSLSHWSLSHWSLSHWSLSQRHSTEGQSLGLSLAPVFAQTSGSGAVPAEDVVVARVGEATITARELDRRMKEMPRNVLETMGSTPAEIRRAYLDQVMVPAALFAEEAKAKGLAERRDIRNRILAAWRLALIRDLKSAAGADTVSDDDVRAFYQANVEKFSVPRQIGIYRILLASESEANALLKELGAAPDAKVWNDIARDKSLDKATRLRGGNLGMVAEDGATGNAGEKVDVALFAAADSVKDGEVVPRPVKEGGKWAVIWKRQTSKASVRPFELEAENIKASLADERLKKVSQEVLTRLRGELVTELNPELCDMVSVSANGELERTKRPGVLPRSKRNASPAPTDGPGGLR